MSDLSDSAEPRRGLAITSIILGQLGVLCLGPIAGIPAIIIGFISLSRARNEPDEYGGQPIAKWGISLGFVSIALVFVYIILAMVVQSLKEGEEAQAMLERQEKYRQSANAGEVPGQLRPPPPSPYPERWQSQTPTWTPSPPPPPPMPAPAAPPPARLRLTFKDIPYALQVLQDGQPDERRAALTYIARSDVEEDLQAKVSRELERFLQNSEHRDLAMNALAQWMTKENIPAIRLMLDSIVRPDYSGGSLESEPAVGMAIQVLGANKDLDAAPAIARCLRHAALRPDAVKALGELGSAAEESVQPILKGTDPAVTQEACKVLKAIGTEKSIPPLQKIMFDRNNQAAKSAQEAVQEIALRSKLDPGKFFYTLIEQYSVPAPAGFVADKITAPNTKQWTRTASGRAVKSVYTVRVSPVDPANPVNLPATNPTIETEKSIVFRQKSITKAESGVTATAEWVAVDGDNLIEISVVGDAYDKTGQAAMFNAVKKIAAK